MGGFSFDPFRFEDFSGFYSGEDYSDPLGYNRFLLAEEEKRKREEEERRRRLSTFGGRVGEYLSPLLQDSPSFSEAVGKVMSIPKMLLSDIPVSELSGLPEILPSQEVLANALFPKRLPGDDPGKRFQTLPSGASIPVDISPEEADISTGLLRGGTKAAGAFGLDPSFPFSFGKGALSSLLGGYFGYQGIKGGSEQIGKGLSELDSLERAKAAESISEGLGSLGMGTMALSGLKHSIPDYSVGGGYRLSSPIHLKPSFDRAFKTPVFGTPIHEGGITGSAVDSVFGPDPILDRAAELLGSDNALKDVPVPNYRGSTPAERVTAYHGTPDVSWALGQGKNYKPQLQETISLLEQTWMDNPEIRQRHPKFRSYAEEALGPDIYEPKNPVFSTRMANPDNLYGGPIYLSESPTYVEGMYSDAETGGPRPGIVETEVNLGKNLDLDAPVPRDIKVRGLAVIGEAIRNAANDQQKAHFQRRYEELKRPDITGREAQRVVGDVLDLATAEG